MDQRLDQPDPTQDIVGYIVTSPIGEKRRLCVDCAMEKFEYGNQKKPIKRDDATDEGRFLSCVRCDAILDQDGYDAWMEEGREAARTYVPPFKSTGDPVADYLIQKGEMEDPRGE